MAETKRTVVVTQYVQELVYDIQNKAYLTGRAREADGSKGYEAASNMQASEDTEEGYQVRRALQTAYTALLSLLGEYIVADNTTTDNQLWQDIDNNGQLSIAFSMPTNYNAASVDAMGSGIHAYLVDKALAEWFIITNPAEANTYAAAAAECLEIVKRALYKRSRPERPEYE